MQEQDMSLPQRPFFSCSEDEFVIVDTDAVKHFSPSGKVEPWLALKKGAGNVFESSPKKVMSVEEGVVTVECEEGIVILDFQEGSARKRTGESDFVYLGTLLEGNDGKGYMPVR